MGGHRCQRDGRPVIAGSAGGYRCVTGRGQYRVASIGLALQAVTCRDVIGMKMGGLHNLRTQHRNQQQCREQLECTM